MHNKPSVMVLLLLALLPVPLKLKETRQKDNSSAENNTMIQKVLAEVLRGLRKLGEEGVMLGYSDGKKRYCFPVLCAWIIDHMEYILLHNIKNNICPKCEVPPEGLGKPL